MTSESTRTEGEKLFEQYLASQALPFEFEKQYAGKLKHPDYTIEWNRKSLVFDVKDFQPEQDRVGCGAFDPLTPIREKINKGCDKFKEYKEFCCALVLFKSRSPLVLLQNIDIMLGSMYGDSGFTIPVNRLTGVGDATKVKQAFLGNGKMIRPNWSKPQNTTISALITLSTLQPYYVRLREMILENRNTEIGDYEAELQRTIPNYDPNLVVPRVIVWHNAVARIPFPNNLFCGEYDTHFGLVQTEDGWLQEITFRGRLLPASVKV